MKLRRTNLKKWVGLAGMCLVLACHETPPAKLQTSPAKLQTPVEAAKPVSKSPLPLPQDIDAEPVDTHPVKLEPHPIQLQNGKSYVLNVAQGFELTVAAEGLKRVRFFAKSPDNRYFVTDMYNLTDNSKGAVYILKDFDPKQGRFAEVIPYLTGLRNPNSIAFWTDAQGVM